LFFAIKIIYLSIFFQNDDIEIDVPLENDIDECEIEIINGDEKIGDVNLDDSSSEMRNWSSLLNDDLDTLIPQYNCVSTIKEKSQDESEVKLELEGNLKVIC